MTGAISATDGTNRFVVIAGPVVGLWGGGGMWRRHRVSGKDC